MQAQNFHGRVAVASLKLESAIEAGFTKSHFHGRVAVASLKQ